MVTRFNFLSIVTTILSLVCFKGFSQRHLVDSVISVPMIGTSYSFQIPGGNLANRFGVNSDLQFQFSYKTDRNWVWGISGDYLFGNHVKESGILDSISTSSGLLIASNGDLTDRSFSEEGFSVFAKLGKLIPKWGPNPNSGIMVTGGIGFLEHHIRIDQIDGTDQLVPQLNPQMRMGYDRLTNGIAFNEYFGYFFLGNRRIANFFAGIDITEGFTKDRRNFDYDLMKQDNTQRVDLLYGVRAGWILPLYKRLPKEYYTY